jgi:hypothetical protein
MIIVTCVCFLFETLGNVVAALALVSTSCYVIGVHLRCLLGSFKYEWKIDTRTEMFCSKPGGRSRGTVRESICIAAHGRVE